MSDIQLSWASIFPKFLNIYPFSLESISAFFFIFLWMVFAYFAIRSWSVYRQSKKPIESLIHELEKVDSIQIIQERENLKLRFREVNKNIGHLWVEFDETLIEVNQPNRKVLCNTIDASYFFNERSLSQGLSENRMIAAVPSFLTAIGVIGTFLGLTFGLRALNISDTASVAEMKTGIAAVISGASTAFITSFWGVFTSVLFNVKEKHLEQKIKSLINQLQNRIDEIFPRLSPESQLKSIVENTHESRESLQHLGEKIGESLQASVGQVVDTMKASQEQTQSEINQLNQNLNTSFETMTTSFKESVSEAFNQVASKSSTGSQDALERLVENFMDKFGELGKKQKESLEAASDKFNTGLVDFSGKLDSFSESQSKNNEANSNLIDKVQAIIKDNRDLTDRHQGLTESFEETVKANKQANSTLTATSDALVSASYQFTQSGKTVEEASKALSEAVKNTGLLDEHNQRTSEDLKQTIHKISESLTAFESLADKLGSLNGETQERMNQGIHNLAEHFEALTASLDKRDANSRELDENRRNLITKQSGKISQASEQFERQIAGLLDQFSHLQQKYDDNISASSKANAALKSIAENISSSSSKILSAGEHVESAGSTLSVAVTQAATTTSHLSDQTTQTANELTRSVEQLQTLTGNYVKMTETVEGSFDVMREHQDAYLESLKEQLRKLADQISLLISNYAQQSNEQTGMLLKQWSKEGSAFGEEVKNLAGALSSVVDEVQEKLSA